MLNITCLEDDAILNVNYTIPKPPDNWDMIYLGGTVKNILHDYSDKWKKVQTWTTHAYMINLNKN